MYNTKKRQPTKTTLQVNESYEGETIEQKVERVVNNKEPIKDNSPMMYTERSEGVKPETNIRTDRWDVALDAMDKVTKSARAKREERLGEIAKKNQEKEAKTETKTGAAGESKA